MDNKDTGILLNKEDIELHRVYFEELVYLHGIQTLYRAPKEGTRVRDIYGELDSSFNPPILVGCIFDEHPTIWTMRKLGWNTASNEERSIIHVPYNTPGLISGGVFIIPDPLDHAKGKLFQVYRMSSVGFVYPAAIACELGPVLRNSLEKSSTIDFKDSNFNLVKEEEEEY